MIKHSFPKITVHKGMTMIKKVLKKINISHFQRRGYYIKMNAERII